MKKRITKIFICVIIFLIAFFIKTDIEWVRTALFVISYCVIAYDVLKEAVINILKGNFFDENFLMSIATIGALIIKEYSEAVAVMIFYNIGEIFEMLGQEKSKKAITELMKIRPDYANVKDKNGTIITKKPDEIKIDEQIIIKPGERIPLDGKVIEGNSTIDTSALTGESLPQKIEKDDNVFSGYINLSNVITVKVTKKYEESAISKILQLIQNATENKSKEENFITKFSKIYTPLVIILAIAIFVIGITTKTESAFEWLERALTFLVISCPCALVISVPLSFFVGIGEASKKGILIKGSSYINTLADLKTVVFDKTGTLTKGVFEVQQIITKNISKDELIEYVAMAEHFSNHPIASSVKKLYPKKVNVSRIRDLEEVAGKGIKCKIDDKNIVVGNLKFMTELGIKDLPNNLGTSKNNKKTEVNKGNEKIIKDKKIIKDENAIKDKKIIKDENVIKDSKIIEEKKTINDNKAGNDVNYGIILFVAIDEKYVGEIIISDEIKKDTKYGIQELKKAQIEKLVMLTGDKKEEAERIGKELEIKEIYSELLPEDKVKIVEKLLKNEKGTLAFVGDGINDGPALAVADVGIAMGGLGSDVAIETADVVIMTDEISKISKAINISKTTIKIAKQNIVFAILVKVLILILSFFGLTTMWMAVFADVGVTVIAILNAILRTTFVLQNV